MMKVERGGARAQVITLADVNIVNLERVGFGLRNFDMAVVPKARARRLLPPAP
jgi:nucleosome binding factor SPN SPT16 subunit